MSHHTITYCCERRAEVRLDACAHCATGHRRLKGFHVPTQRKGMIPQTRCEAIVAVKISASSEKPWAVYIDSKLLKDRRGETWEFSTSNRALSMGRRKSPNLEAT